MAQNNPKGTALNSEAPTTEKENQNPAALKASTPAKPATAATKPTGGQREKSEPTARRSGSASAGQPQDKTAAPASRPANPPAGRSAQTETSQVGKPARPEASQTGKPAKAETGSAGKPAARPDTGKPGKSAPKADGRTGSSGQPKGTVAAAPQGQRPAGPTKAGPGKSTEAPAERPTPASAKPTNHTADNVARPASPARPGAGQPAAPKGGRPGSATPTSATGRPGGQPAGHAGSGSRPTPAGQAQAPRGQTAARSNGNGNHVGHKPAQRPATPGQPAPAAQPAAGAAAKTAAAVTEITIGDTITVRDLAQKMQRSAIDVIKALMNYGIMAPITQTIDFDTAQIVGSDLGVTVNREAPPEPEVAETKKEEEPTTLRQQILATEKPEELVVRPPIVTVLGHVDHGKTTLLDAIRETRVVEGEAGGITQHIGAYQVERQGRKITFLDTPGHEAFTAMRARGAMVTDIAVLVVAADDGVMPQTKEAIAHARAAKVPIIVALNKIDKPAANPERVKQELADNGLLIEEYGGDVICVPVSAKFRRGIDDLLENILLVADIDPLKANPNGNCVGTVIESRLDKTRGPVATLLVQNGTLRVGDSIVAGDVYGKVRAMYDDKGRPLTEALPSTPVVVLGMSDVAIAGDTFSVVADERTARAIATERQAKRRAEATAAAAPKTIALENIFAQAQSGQTKELNLILKCDVQGSLEPIVSSLEKLGDEKLHVKILHQATGAINESDVMLAIASKAIILGFNVTADAAAQRMAEAEGVDIRIYNIIYNLVEDIEKALKGLLEPVYKEVVLGHAEVRAVFRISKVGRVAGCYVVDGEIQRGALARVKRAGQVIHEDRIGSLKRFQEDVTEVKAGFECGLSLNNFTEIEVGDLIEAYKKERVS